MTRKPRCGKGRTSAAAAVAVVLFCAGAGLAAPAPASNGLRVSNDAGGDLADRIAYIEALRNEGRPVEIRTGYCHSACTLYLGLPGTCVSPDAVFGFHGPQMAAEGLAMLPSRFDHWSHIMAAHYPVQLRGWFMERARYSKDLILIRGSQLIAAGIPGCQ